MIIKTRIACPNCRFAVRVVGSGGAYRMEGRSTTGRWFGESPWTTDSKRSAADADRVMISHRHVEHKEN